MTKIHEDDVNVVNVLDDYKKQLEEGNLEEALESLEKLDSKLKKNQFIGSLKIETLSQLGRDSDALELANSLSSNSKFEYSKMHMQRAQLLYAYWQNADDLQAALSSIEKAISLFDNESAVESIEVQLTDSESLKGWINERSKSLTDMTALRVDIKSMINANIVYQEVLKVQAETAQEKVKTIELMAIFTAILALIFANVQFVSLASLQQVVVVNIALTLVLTWLLHVARNIARGEPILPRFILPDSISKFIGKVFGLILVGCFVVGVFAATILFVVKVAEWVGLS